MEVEAVGPRLQQVKQAPSLVGRLVTSVDADPGEIS